jgi:LacI family transcriptional regulator
MMKKNTRQPNNTSVSFGHVSIHDIAARLGVSATTVWNAVNNRGRISRENRQKILDVVNQMGYRPSLVAQTLAGCKSRLIGVVVPLIDGAPFSAMVCGVETIACEQDYNIILCNTGARPDLEKKYIDLLVRRRVEGIVIVPYVQKSTQDYQHLVDLEALGIGVVVIEQDIPEPRLTRIVPENLNDARRMTEHLLQLGHQKIGFFQMEIPEGNIAALERLAGYKQALVKAGVKYHSSLVFDTALLLSHESHQITDSLAEFFCRPDRPTAIFTNNDWVAIRLMDFLCQIGLRVPEDIAVVGFNDSAMAAFTVPPLTTVRQPADQVGRRAAKVLFERISGLRNENTWPIHERISGQLIIRRSCGSSLQDKNINLRNKLLLKGT